MKTWAKTYAEEITVVAAIAGMPILMLFYFYLLGRVACWLFKSSSGC